MQGETPTLENTESPLWKRMTLYEIWEKLDKQYSNQTEQYNDELDLLEEFSMFSTL